ncbi:ANKRD50 [Symbiodinium necroappetens]|uniref:ANKRD50 protein n=1 Tax=Symbiodinium necroappetens TaxID=1628268 RepID=A0A812XP47_9DINO|nr:ANKRD50 [Symbiodinium necroappetens]
MNLRLGIEVGNLFQQKPQQDIQLFLAGKSLKYCKLKTTSCQTGDDDVEVGVNTDEVWTDDKEMQFPTLTSGQTAKSTGAEAQLLPFLRRVLPLFEASIVEGNRRAGVVAPPPADEQLGQTLVRCSLPESFVSTFIGAWPSVVDVSIVEKWYGADHALALYGWEEVVRPPPSEILGLANFMRPIRSLVGLHPIVLGGSGGASTRPARCLYAFCRLSSLTVVNGRSHLIVAGSETGSLLVYDLRARARSPADLQGESEGPPPNPDADIAHFEGPVWLPSAFSTDVFALGPTQRESDFGEQNGILSEPFGFDGDSSGVHEAEICCVRSSDMAAGDALVFAGVEGHHWTTCCHGRGDEGVANPKEKGAAKEAKAAKGAVLALASRQKIGDVNRALRACKLRSAWEAASLLLTTSGQKSLQADVVSYTTLVGASMSKTWEWAIGIFADVARKDLILDKVAELTLFTGFAALGKWVAALSSFADLQVQQTEVDQQMATSAMTSCAGRDTWASAIALICKLQTACVEIDTAVVNAAMSAMSGAGGWMLALSALEDVATRQSIDVISINAALSACERSGQWQPAMSLLEGCLPSVPDIISYGAAVSACEKEGRWEEAVYLLSRLPQVRIAGDVSFYNAVISASEKGSRWQMALQLLPMISVLRLEADVVSYSSAISACQKCDEWRVALLLLSEMEMIHVKVDTIACNSAISACSWLKALGVLNTMQFCAVRSTIITFGSITSCFESMGRWQLALQILRIGKMQTLRLQDITCNAAIGACEKGALDITGTVSFWRVLELASVGVKLALQGSLALARGPHSHVLADFLGASYLCIHPQQQGEFVALSTAGIRQANRQRSLTSNVADGPRNLELLRHAEEEEGLLLPSDSFASQPCSGAFNPFFPGLLLVAFAEGDLALFDCSLCVPVTHWASAVGKAGHRRNNLSCMVYPEACVVGPDKDIEMLDGGEHLDEAIKKQLQVGASPFQQRLYLRGEEVLDVVRTSSNPPPEEELQVVVLPLRYDAAADLRLQSAAGDLAKIKQLLREPQAPDPLAPCEFTPLQLASRYGHLEVVRALLAAGADKDRQGLAESTPLLEAIDHQHLHVARHLVRIRADIGKAGLGGTTPLLVAVERGDLKAAKLLVESGADKEQPDASGLTPLHAACGHLDMVKFLLSMRANQNVQDTNGKTPLRIAAGIGHADVVECLVLSGADKDMPDALLVSPLWAAARNGRNDVVQHLLHAGADHDQADIDGETPLRAAAEHGHLEVVLRLLRGHADVNKQDIDGRTPLLAAAHAGKLEVVEILLQWHAIVDCIDSEGQTPLLAASEHGFVDVCRSLLDRHADVNHCRADGTTSSKLAAQRGELEVLRLLHFAGALVDHSDHEGVTPLWAAANSGKLKVVQYLLEQRADVAKACRGQSCLQAASQRCHSQVVSLLTPLDHQSKRRKVGE